MGEAYGFNMVFYGGFLIDSYSAMERMGFQWYSDVIWEYMGYNGI